MSILDLFELNNSTNLVRIGRANESNKPVTTITD